MWAFGGHRVLMAILQVLSAEMAGLERVVFHTGNARGAEDLVEARRVIEEDMASAPGVDAAELLERLVSLGFEWGTSDKP
jgi:hypothetical protein